MEEMYKRWGEEFVVQGMGSAARIITGANI